MGKLLYALDKIRALGKALEVLAFLAYIIGFSGLRSNSVQFSLDQLQEALVRR